MYDDYILLKVGEDFVYKIEEAQTLLLGTIKDIELPDAELQDAIIKFSYSEDDWTNKNVTVTIAISNAEEYAEFKKYEIEYSYDLKAWNLYKQPLVITENTLIYARLTNRIASTNNYATGEVGNIEKTSPVITEVSSTTNKIEIKATDDESGIKYYAITESNSEPETWITLNESTKSLDIAVNGYKQNNTYYIFVRDEAGNVSESSSVETDTVTSGLVDGAIEYTNATWANGKASTTISTNTTYSIQYQVNDTDENNWINGTSVTNLSSGDIVYARLWDGYNGGAYATYEVGDGTEAVIDEFTHSNGVLTIRASDEESGVSGYAITTSASAPADSAYTSWDGSSKTISNATTNVDSYLWIKNGSGLTTNQKFRLGAVTHSHTHTSSCVGAHQWKYVGISTYSSGMNFANFFECVTCHQTAIITIGGVIWSQWTRDNIYESRVEGSTVQVYGNDETWRTLKNSDASADYTPVLCPSACGETAGTFTDYTFTLY